MAITPEQLIRLIMSVNREDKFVLKEQLAKIATAIPSGRYVLFAYDYALEDDDSGFTQQMANQQWAYTVELWYELMAARDEWWEERELYRGTGKAFWHVRALRESGLSRHFKWLMPEGWKVERGQIPGDPEERDGFYIQVG